MKIVVFGLLCQFVIGVTAYSQTVEFKNPPALGKTAGYSQVVVVNRGKLVFISGQTGLNAKGEMPSDFAAQAKQAFTNLKTALSAVGATTQEIVKLNYYVVGLNHDRLLVLRDARDSVIDKEHPPASTLAGVQALFRDDALIEIEAEAVLP